MDLSNLHTSLRESEASSLRRTTHLRSAEDELNAFFRSSALSLTTLYRQGVAQSKASYEKGYAHALAHVLELWGEDKQWLKGYLQRRIEALEQNDVEDTEQQVEEVHAGPSNFNTTAAARGRDSPRQGNKRARSSFRQREEEAETADRAERRTVRMPTQASASPFSSTFNFASPVAYPAPTHDPSTSKPRHAKAESGGVIKTSTPASSRRRLQKLKGLRAGRDRIIEVEQPQTEDMVDEDEVGDNNAWTDEEDDEAKRGKKVVWSERKDEGMEEGRVLERMDRRKRRRSRKVGAGEGVEKDEEEMLRDAPYHS